MNADIEVMVARIRTCVPRVCARNRTRRYRPNGSGSVRICIFHLVAMARQRCTAARVSCWMSPLPMSLYSPHRQRQPAPSGRGILAAMHHPHNRMSGCISLLVIELLPSCSSIFDCKCKLKSNDRSVAAVIRLLRTIFIVAPAVFAGANQFCWRSAKQQKSDSNWIPPGAR